MSWFLRKAEELHGHPDLRDVVLALAELEASMALDLTKLQADVTAQGDLIAKVKADVDGLKATQGSSADQTAVDAIAATVETNNAALTALVTPPST